MSTNPANQLTATQLRKAADIREEIEALEAQLDALLSGGSPPAPRATAPATSTVSAPAKKKDGRKAKKGKRTLSPEALERIRAGQARRWAKVHAAAGTASPPAKKKTRGPGRPKGTTNAAASGKKPKRKMSAEGRARIQAAVKARWARVAAEKGGKRKAK